MVAALVDSSTCGGGPGVSNSARQRSPRNAVRISVRNTHNLLARAALGVQRGQGSPLLAAPTQRSQSKEGRTKIVCSAAAATTANVVGAPTFKVRLLRPDERKAGSSNAHLLVYLPGTDGSGQAVIPQIPGLQELGYDVWTLFVPPEDRSDWQQLTDQVGFLLRQLSGEWAPGASNSDTATSDADNGSEATASGATPQQRQQVRITLVGESFGGCLALRLALAYPDLVQSLVLVNPATCFSRAMGGLPSLISATNLLGLFPKALYNTAQAVLLPLMVNSERVGQEGTERMRAMIFMEPPPFTQSVAYMSVPDNTLVYAPAAAANFRANLLRSGGVEDRELAGVRAPTLVLSGARDRLLPSIEEGARLQRCIPRCRRVLLPESGHAALLEEAVSLASIMKDTGFHDLSRPPFCDAHAHVGAAAAGGGSSSSSSSVSASGSSSSGEGWQRAKGSSSAPDRLPTSLVAAAAATAAATAAGTSGSEDVAPAAAGSTSQLASSHSSSSSSSTSAAVGSSSSAGKRAVGKAERLQNPVGGRDENFDRWCQRLSPWRDVVSPVLLGEDNLPAPGSEGSRRPMLFVGNHQRMGFYDTPLFVMEMYLRGYTLRGLAHPGHWSGPFGKWFEEFGTVKATPMAAYKLLKSGEKVLLFPGGAKEVTKARSQEYTLMWRDTPDFVRMAARCNALVVPFAAVGADDAYDIAMETEEVLAHPVLGPLARGLLERVDGNLKPNESIFPITRLPVLGLPAPIPVPNLQRLYFKIGAPIDLGGLALEDPEACQTVYDGIRQDVVRLLDELLAYRAQDPEQRLPARALQAVNRWLPLMTQGRA